MFCLKKLEPILMHIEILKKQIMSIFEWNMTFIQEENIQEEKTDPEILTDIFTLLNRADKHFRPCMKVRKNTLIFQTTSEILINKIC